MTVTTAIESDDELFIDEQPTFGPKHFKMSVVKLCHFFPSTIFTTSSRFNTRQPKDPPYSVHGLEMDSNILNTHAKSLPMRTCSIHACMIPTDSNSKPLAPLHSTQPSCTNMSRRGNRPQSIVQSAVPSEWREPLHPQLECC